MASPQDESIKIVIEVVDKFSPPLRELKSKVEDFGKQGEHVSKVTKQTELLSEGLRGISRVAGEINPKLQSIGNIALGVTGGLVGVVVTITAAMAGMVKVVKDAAETKSELSYLSKETGFAIDTMYGLEAAAAKVDVSTDSMRRGYSELANQISLARIGQGKLYDILKLSHTAEGDRLADAIRMSTSNEEAIKLYFEAIDKEVGDRAEQHKKAWLEAAGFDPKLARISGEELLRQGREFTEKWGKITDKQIADSRRFQQTLAEIGISLRGLGDSLAKGGTLELVNKAIGKLSETIADPDFATGVSEFAKNSAIFAENMGKAASVFGDDKPVKPGDESPSDKVTKFLLEKLMGPKTKSDVMKSWFWRHLFGLPPEEVEKPVKQGSFQGGEEGIVGIFRNAIANASAGGGGALVQLASLGGFTGGYPPGGGPSGAPPMGSGARAGAGAAVSTDTNATLGEVRAAQMRELADPAVRDELMAYTEAEVGGQGNRTKQAFIESVLNRAAARKQTIRQALHSSYYPSITHQRAMRGVTNAMREDYAPIMGAVAGGSNVSGYATGNASGNVGFAGGPQTYNPRTGDRFGIEGPDRRWAENMRSAEEKQASRERLWGRNSRQIDNRAGLSVNLFGFPPGMQYSMSSTGNAFNDVTVSRDR